MFRNHVKPRWWHPLLKWFVWPQVPHEGAWECWGRWAMVRLAWLLAAVTILGHLLPLALATSKFP